MRAKTTRYLFLLPLSTLADCDAPMFPDGILPPRGSVAAPTGGVILAAAVLALLFVLAVAAVGGRLAMRAGREAAR